MFSSTPPSARGLPLRTSKVKTVALLIGIFPLFLWKILTLYAVCVPDDFVIFAADMNELKIYNADLGVELPLPFADEGVRAGFPSPAQDYISDSIDLNRDIIRHSDSTFYARAQGDSMIDAGVHSGDILVIDKALTPHHGDMAVCCVDGEFTLKFVEKHGDYILLVPANPEYKPIRVDSGQEFLIWGVVTYIIHKTRKG